MANEVTKIELYGANNDGQGVRYTVNTGSNYAKGTLMQVVSGTTRTAAPITNGAASGAVAGILAMDASGVTNATLWTQGIFEFTLSGTGLVGEPVLSLGSRNLIMVSNLAGSTAVAPFVFGHLLKAATDLQRTSVRVNL